MSFDIFLLMYCVGVRMVDISVEFRMVERAYVFDDEFRSE